MLELKAQHEFLLDLQEKVSSGTTPFFVVWTTEDDLYD